MHSKKTQRKIGYVHESKNIHDFDGWSRTKDIVVRIFLLYDNEIKDSGETEFQENNAIAMFLELALASSLF